MMKAFASEGREGKEELNHASERLAAYFLGYRGEKRQFKSERQRPNQNR